MRLTENGMAMKNSLDEKENQVSLIYNKLGQLEDILEEFNILDLSELRIALENERKGTDAFANWWEKRFAELLKPYKDIENELGIDLVTLIKALKQDTLFIKTDIGIKETIKSGEGWAMKILKLKDDKIIIFTDILYPNDITHKEWLTPITLQLSDYKKYWALTKEELE